VVGDPGHASNAGRAYAFDETAAGWRQGAELKGSDTVDNDYFGEAVAISGTTIVVGAPGHADGAGRAYVFTKNSTGWDQAAELQGLASAVNPGASAAGDEFGLSVAVSGNTIVVGAPNYASTGRVYVFTWSGTDWHATAKIDGTVAHGGFGVSVEISGMTMVVGDPNQSQPGRAYLFTKGATGWQQGAQLEDPRVPAPGASVKGPAPHETFGSSVAISGSTVAVSAPADAVAPGSTYIFTRSARGWEPSAETKDLTSFGAQILEPVAVSGNTVLVGGEASAYVFTKSAKGWDQSVELRAHGPLGNDAFGCAVAASGATLVFGSTSAPVGGRVYVFKQ
jgi:hypothetical protein